MSQLTGDLDGNGRVNAFDLSILLNRLSNNDPGGDINNDGNVDVFDLSVFLSKWGNTLSDLPAIPSAVHVIAHNSEVALFWDSAASATNYTIKRSLNNTNNFVTIAENLTSTSYIDTTAVNGSTYFYVVCATNKAGESGASSAINAQPDQSADTITHGEQLQTTDVGYWAYYDYGLERFLRHSDLTVHSGNFYTSYDGQFIDKLDIQGNVYVSHQNVTIEACRINGYVQIDPGLPGGFSRTKLFYTELDGSGIAHDATPAITHARYWAERCYVHDFGEMFRANGDVHIVECLVSDFYDFVAQGGHQDAVQITAGNDVEILRSKFLINKRGTNQHLAGANASIMIGTAQGGVNNFLVSDCYAAGGTYVYRGGVDDSYNYTNDPGEQNGPAAGVQFIYNVVGQDFLTRNGSQFNYSPFAAVDPGEPWKDTLYYPYCYLLNNRWGPAGPHYQAGTFPAPNSPIGPQG